MKVVLEIVRRTLMLFVIGASLLAVVGCAQVGGGSPSTSATPTTNATEAKTQVCNALSSISTSLDSMSKAGANTTVGDLKARQSAIATRLDLASRVASKLEQIPGTTISQLQDINDSLGAALKDLPNDAMLQEASPNLQDFRAKVAQAQQVTSTARGRLNCP